MTLPKFIDALNHLYESILGGPETPVVILGDFNINFMESSSELKALLRNMSEQKGYIQLINEYTTDYRTQIDHIYTNIKHLVSNSGVLESYFSDHKPLFLCLNC